MKVSLRARSAWIAGLTVAALALLLPVAQAQGEDADAAVDAASAELARPPLIPLPMVPSQELPKATAEHVEQVSALLTRISSDDPSGRQAAQEAILEADPRWVSAISEQLDALADSTKGEELRKKLQDLREKARSAERERMKAANQRGEVKTPDYLEILLSFAEPKDERWVAVTQVVALSRLLGAISTTEAVRTLIRIYVRFGEFLRVDTQLQLEKLGDRALPALIETRRHQAPKIARWAERQLDALGKAIPSEAVQVPDPDVLADVLRAYGYTRDPDAARVVISFANSERPQVREAARQSVALMKEVANWPLRDTYANIVGKKPPGDWSWDRTARELFGEFDRLRLAQVYKLFNQGQKAAGAQKTDEAKALFDQVLARSPLFEQRAEMVPTYVAFAEAKLDDDPQGARTALSRARRLSEDAEVTRRAEALLWLLDGRELVARGVADQVPFRRALELDPSNERAKKHLEEIQRGERAEEQETGRYYGAVAIGVVALLSVLVIGLRRGKPEPSATLQGAEEAREVAQPEVALPHAQPEVAQPEVALPHAQDPEPLTTAPSAPTPQLVLRADPLAPSPEPTPVLVAAAPAATPLAAEVATVAPQTVEGAPQPTATVPTGGIAEPGATQSAAQPAAAQPPSAPSGLELPPLPED